MNHYVETLAPQAKKNTVTNQMAPIPGREKEMVRNSAGGFTFTLDQWGYLDRFLILGSDQPTYYASAQKLTKAAAGNVLKCIASDGVRTVNRIVEVSDEGRAPKNDSAVFALALAAINGNQETVAAAYAALPKVARTGTHLFQFVAALDAMGKWNAAAKRGVAAWYTKRAEDKLAVQLLKYQSRDGWAHRDVLRLAHVKPQTELQSALFRYSVKGADAIELGTQVPQLLVDFEMLKRSTTAGEVVRIIESNKDITWEMVPTQFHRDKNVMSALVKNMGMTALIRKLGQLTNIGVIQNFSEDTKAIIAKLSDGEAIRKGRVHPITILTALKQYSMGRGQKGDLTWSTNQRVVDALNDSFYEAFKYVESTGQGYLLGIDISGSMFGSPVGQTGLTAAEVAAVMALGVAKRESNYEMFGFDNRPKPLKISPNMRLDAALKAMRDLHWSAGSTDCSQPMLYAMENRYEGVDKFCVYTDNETYAGRIQPVEALRQYRQKYNRNSKLIVCGTSVTNFTIADPKDPGMLDIVGFDSAAPQLIQTF